MYGQDKCVAFIGSITVAMRARDILARSAIPSTVIKDEMSSSGNRGCVYGISFSCVQMNNVRSFLEREGIRVKKWS